MLEGLELAMRRPCGVGGNKAEEIMTSVQVEHGSKMPMGRAKSHRKCMNFPSVYVRIPKTI